MEASALVVDKLKSFAKSTQDFASGILRWPEKSKRRSPIEILKRLQREAFSDIMKLRDRQEKVERVLAFYKSSKGSPFQDASSHVRGEFDAVGALLMIGTIDEFKRNAIERAGIRTGIDSRFTFDTTVREKDSFVAEFVASERGQSDILGSPLSLAKVLYSANISDWFSAVAIPVGARCRDVSVAASSCEERGRTDYSSFAPPLLNQLNGSALGVMVRRSSTVASLAQFVSRLGVFPNSAGIMYCFSTFGQIVFQLSSSTKLSVLGIHKMPRKSSNQISLGAMTAHVGILQQHTHSETSTEEDGSPVVMNRDGLLDGSIAFTLESQLDESTRIGGWVEMKQSNPKNLQWAVTMSDTPDDDFGWGLSLGGLLQGPKSWDHFQVETFLNFNIGKKCRLQPGALYVMDGATQFPALMFRSTWSL